MNIDAKATVVTMSVHEVIQKRKFFAKRLDQIHNCMKSGIKVPYCNLYCTGMSGEPEEKKLKIENRAISNFQTVVVLYNNIKVVDSAILEFNVTNKIKFDNKEYSIIEAINSKKRSSDEILFYEYCLQQLEKVETEIIEKNIKISHPAVIGQFVSDSLKDGDLYPIVDADIIAPIIDKFKDLNVCELIDPNNIYDTATKKLEEIRAFKDGISEEIDRARRNTNITITLDLSLASN